MARCLPALLIVVLGLGAVDAHAQANEDRRSVRLAAGVLSQQGTFGDDSPRTSDRQPGTTFSAGFRRHPAKPLGLTFEGALEPIAIKNPHLNESVSRLYLQLGLEIGRRIYVRPAIGGSVNSWSGSDSSGMSIGPAASLSVGYRHAVSGDLFIQPELVMRSAFEIGALTQSVGVQIAVSHRRW